MKIALIYDAVYPYVKGGAERRYYELAKRLTADHEVHLLGMKFWQGDDVIRTDEGLFLHGVCRPVEMYVRGRRSILQAIYFAVKLLFPLMKERFDLIDCPSAPYFPLFTCKLYSRFRGRPFIVAWLEYWGDYWYEYLGWLGVWGKLAEKLATRLPDHIIAISDHTGECLVENGVRADKITAIPLGMNVSEIEAVESSEIESDVIFAGRLIREKNVDTLICVIGELVNRRVPVKCCIVGDGPEREKLESLAGSMGLMNHITFFGFLEHQEEVYALMKSSRVFVFLSSREGFGLVVPEANACGLPVIVVKAKHNAASSLVRHEESGFVCDLDVEQIANTTQRLLTDDVMYDRMRSAAVAWAQQFDWDVTARRTEQVYLNMAARN